MYPRERFAMAAELLYSLHQRDDPDAPFPSERLVNRFVDAIIVVCPSAGGFDDDLVIDGAMFLYSHAADELGPE